MFGIFSLISLAIKLPFALLKLAIKIVLIPLKILAALVKAVTGRKSDKNET